MQQKRLFSQCQGGKSLEFEIARPHARRMAERGGLPIRRVFLFFSLPEKWFFWQGGRFFKPKFSSARPIFSFPRPIFSSALPILSSARPEKWFPRQGEKIFLLFF